VVTDHCYVKKMKMRKPYHYLPLSSSPIPGPLRKPISAVIQEEGTMVI
jgi:hypothetical protein